MPAPGLPHLIWPQKGAQPRRWSRSHRATENFQLNSLLRDPNQRCGAVFLSFLLRETFSGLSAALWVHDDLWTFLTRGHHRVTNPTIFMTMSRSSFVGVQEKLDTKRMVVYSNQKHVDLTNMWTWRINVLHQGQGRYGIKSWLIPLTTGLIVEQLSPQNVFLATQSVGI